MSHIAAVSVRSFQKYSSLQKFTEEEYLRENLRHNVKNKQELPFKKHYLDQGDCLRFYSTRQVFMCLCPPVLHYSGDKNAFLGKITPLETLCLIFLGRGSEIVSPDGQYLWADKPPWQQNMLAAE